MSLSVRPVSPSSFHMHSAHGKHRLLGSLGSVGLCGALKLCRHSGNPTSISRSRSNREP